MLQKLERKIKAKYHIIGFKKDPLEYEHCWGMPETQKVMFTAYKEAGFDCVRIPVSWLNAMDIANGDYTIDS